MNDRIDDYISRKIAEKIIAEVINRGGTEAEILTEIHYCPAVDVVEVRHGQWMLNDDESVAFCSECDCAIPTKWGKDMTWLYCPECGAMMDE